MTWGEWLLVFVASGVSGLACGWFAGTVVASFRRARVVVDASPDHDDTLDVMDAVFPPTRAEGNDVP